MKYRSSGGIPRFFLFILWLIFLGILGLLLQEGRPTIGLDLMVKASAIGWLLVTIAILRGNRRLIFVALIAIGMGFIFLTNEKPIDPVELHQSFVGRVEAQLGVPFRVEGFSRRGIDQIGLIKKSLIETYLILSIKDFNLPLLKRAYGLWVENISLETFLKRKSLFEFSKQEQLLSPEALLEVKDGDIFISTNMHESTIAITQHRVASVSEALGRVSFFSIGDPELKVMREPFTWIRLGAAQ